MANPPDWRNTQPRIKPIPPSEIHKASPGLTGDDPADVITLPKVTKVDYPASREPALTFGGLPRHMRGDKS